jgi:6-phosphogluconolactonase
MKIGKWARLMLGAAALALAGCGNFWQNPYTSSSSGDFSLSNSGNITVSPGASTGNTSTISVTPASSFTGTVTLTCAVTGPTNATSPATCNLSPASVSITDTNPQTATLTAATTSTTTAGAYQITVTGVSGSTSETTSVCAEVTTSSGTCSAATGTSGNFYVLNQTTHQAAAFNISSGTLNAIGALTLPGSQPPLAIAVAPNGQFLYVSTITGIYLYTIDSSSGALTLGNGGVAVSTDPATTMQVDATNSWLVDAISGTTNLFAVAIDSTTGELATAGETEQTLSGGLPASTPTQLAISPNDSSCTNCYVFVGLGAGGTEVIGFNPSSANPFGNTGHFNVLNSGGDNAVAVDPGNLLLYVGESDALPSASQSGGVRVFTIGTGGVTEVSGSPYTTGGTGPSAILPTSDGNYVYVANRSVSGSSTGNISSYSVATTGLSFIATAAAGPTGVLSLAEDSTGGYLLATDSAGNPDLEAYTISSGTLTSVLSVATGTDPVSAIAIAAAPQ